MINRSFLSLLVAFLLTFAQHLALTHPYEHAADWQKKSSSQKNTLPHSDNCDKCIALAGIGSAVGAKSQSFHALNTTFEFLPSATQPIFSAHFQPYQSRAPPYLA